MGDFRDREADMMAMIRRASELGTPADWLVRAKHNRCLPDRDGEKLRDVTTDGAALGEMTWCAMVPNPARLTRHQP